MTRRFSEHWHNFWFRPVSAAGFGMMRIGFGTVAFVTFLLEWSNVDRFFGPAGVMPREMVGDALRTSWRFSLIDSVGTTGTYALYVLLLIALAMVIVGIRTRLALLVSVILLYSFHEYGTTTLDGGDTLLRLIGFILLLSPCDRAFTCDNLRRRLRLTRETGKDQPSSERTMPIWPYRLLLYQMILIYVSSSLEKWSGETWRIGSAVAITLHHPHFTRLSPALADALSSFSPVIGYFTLITQAAWGLLLLLGLFSALGLISTWPTNAFKRALMLCGILVHGGIFLLMDVGTFSLTVLVAYLGLLLDDDFRAIRARLNKRRKDPVVVLFDGRCGFCKKSVFVLSMLDFLHRLEFANYHDPNLKKKYAPKLDLQTLNEAMHLRLADGTYRKGFFAFRALAWHFPVFWLLAPLLYTPGVPLIGEKAYQFVADHR